MNLKVKIGPMRNPVSITDKMYMAAGGEASIYLHGNNAIKIYHDSHKVLPAQKIAELEMIGNPHVMIPNGIVYSADTGKPLGYTAPWIKDAFPLLKFFTRTFKDDKGISTRQIADLVKMLQLITADIHMAKCLVVDFNELNVLVKIGAVLDPFFIDTDSYATPSYKATAIMDSVRDRRVSIQKNGQLHYNPDEYSDWFSWAVLSFWLYTNIHPFRGTHPKYKPREKSKQMDDGISVFHNGVRVPPTVNDFSIIPRRHLSWFKAVFVNGERSQPPMPDVSGPIAVPASIVTVKGTNLIDVIQTAAFSEPVLLVAQRMGISYTVTRGGIYAGNRRYADYEKGQKVLLCSTSDARMVLGTQRGSQMVFSLLPGGERIGTIGSQGAFARNDAIYTVAGGKLIENSFDGMGKKVFHAATETENISDRTATVYEGCVIQDLLGKKYLTVPYGRGRCRSIYIHELDGFRVVEAKSEGIATVILAERKNRYHRFLLIFHNNFSGYNSKETEDVAYDAINFTVFRENLVILLASPAELEIYSGNTVQYEVLSDPPFDSTMRLFSTPDGAFFINGTTIHQIKRKQK